MDLLNIDTDKTLLLKSRFMAQCKVKTPLKYAMWLKYIGKNVQSAAKNI